VILVDTSVWIGHFRRRDVELVELLRAGRVATCDVVTAELRLGSGIPEGVPQLLSRLPHLPVPDARRALAFLDAEGSVLAGAGIGFADLLLVTCARDSGSLSRTPDVALGAAWCALGYAAA